LRYLGIKHQASRIHGCVVLKHKVVTCTTTHLHCATAPRIIIYLLLCLA